MSPERFEDLLTLVGPLIAKKPCRSRSSISEAERLMVTLRYLATGDSQQSQSFSFRIGRSTISNVLRETCEGIWLALKGQYLKTPSTTSDWLRIATEFEEEWNFPNCIGAIDGKHIMMDCPKNGGSAYYNYKGFHSIAAIAVFQHSYFCTSSINKEELSSDVAAILVRELQGNLRAKARKMVTGMMLSGIDFDRPDRPDRLRVFPFDRF